MGQTTGDHGETGNHRKPTFANPGRQSRNKHPEDKEVECQMPDTTMEEGIRHEAPNLAIGKALPRKPEYPLQS